MSRFSIVAKCWFSLLIMLVSACTNVNVPQETPTVTLPAPTQTVVPSATMTVVPTNTYTPTPAKVFLTFTKNAFCRKGPSSQYFDKGSFNQGDVVEVQGRNDEESRWWYMLMENGDHCWVSDTTVEPNPSAEALPVREPEQSLPITPADLWADRFCKPAKNGFIVTFYWTPNGTAEGYYIYVNGEMIQDVTSASQTEYGFVLPLNEPVSYAFEAYNSIGSGERVSFDDPGCP